MATVRFVCLYNGGRSQMSVALLEAKPPADTMRLPVGTTPGEQVPALARRKPAVPDHAAIDHHQAPADRLPLSDGGHDAVTCRQGLQFFPQRRTLREMRPALRPSGRVGIARRVSAVALPPKQR
jgi:hypothetical protein